ncbi:hypothetical protein LTR85_007905 [Meristemomyces frigidus]|nr:hypothetical protein LTR85_007905 [Meristemomyces frigidus]
MASVPPWGEMTTGSEVAEHFEHLIRDKNVVITGVSPKLLGETLALKIARHGPANLILASRTRPKLEQVAEQIVEASPRARLSLLELDLSSQAATRHAADAVVKLVSRIDILINNAAVVTSERSETTEGARHSSQPGMTRVVNVTSLGYRLSPIRFHDYNFEGKAIPPEEEPAAGIPPHMKPDLASGRPYFGFTAYGQSKTANILHAVSLSEKLGDKGVRAFAVHPGSIWTELSRNLSPDDLKVIEGTSTFWKDQDQGVATMLVAALDPKLTQTSNKVFLSDCQVDDVADHAKDPAIAERLWQLSEKLTGEDSQL